MSIVEPRSTRNQLLARAAAVGVAAGVALLATQVIYLVHLFSFIFHPRYREVGAVIDLVGGVALVAAFLRSRAGFLQDARGDRTRMLAVAAGLFAVYGGANFLRLLLEVVNAPAGEPRAYTAARAAFMVGELALLATGVLVGVALRSSRPGRLLGWGCVAFAGHYLFAAAGYGFSLAGIVDLYHQAHFGLPDRDRVITEYVANVVGYVVAAIAAGMGAIAFAAGNSGRDRELGIAAVLFAAGFLTYAVGLIAGVSSRWSLSNGLALAFPLLLAAAAGIGAMAFFSLEQRDGPDLPVVPDPA